MKTIYDDEVLHKNYAKMRADARNANDLIEQPFVAKLLPNFEGKRVLDLGCGMGKYIIDYMSEADLVDAVEPSEKMLGNLKKALRAKKYSHVNVSRCAIEDYVFKHNYYDVVLSTLVFHYIKDLKPVFKNIYASLRPNGLFIFSVEHPILTAARNIGWEMNEKGEYAHWRLDDYFDTGVRRSLWFGAEVEKYHRTVEDYYRMLVHSKFHITAILEPKPNSDARKLSAEIDSHHRRPIFLMFSAMKS